MRSAVFLTEAISLAETSQSTHNKVEDEKRLLLNVMNQALGNTGISPPFDSLKGYTQYPQLVQDIIKAKNELLGGPHNPINNLNDITALCRFIGSEHVSVLQASFSFWQVPGAPKETKNEISEQTKHPVSDFITSRHPIFSPVDSEDNPKKRKQEELQETDDDLAQQSKNQKH